MGTKIMPDDFINSQFQNAVLEDYPELSFGNRWFFEYVDRISDLYISFRQRYVVMKQGFNPYCPKNADGSYRKLDNKAMCLHMMGKHAISVFAGPCSSKFICFDVDDGSKESVHMIIDKAEEIGVPRKLVYVSTSGGKGYHVEIFFDGFVYTYMLAAFYKKICKECGFDEKKIEFRPTKGQAIKLPLSKHYKTDNTCWYLDRDTFEPIKDREYLFEIQQMNADAFVKIAEGKCQNGTVTNKITTTFGKYESRVIDEMGDPNESKIQVLSDGWPMLTCGGMRYKTMLAIAIYERYHGADKEDLRNRFDEWISVQAKEYITDDQRRIDYDIRKIVEWVFGPSFHCGAEERNISITDSDVFLILSQKSKTRRKFVFLTLFFEKRFGCLRMSSKRIGDYINCRFETVLRTVVPSLVAQGVIRKETGKWRIVNTNLIRDSNKYWVCPHVEGIQKINCSGSSVQNSERLIPENFDEVFYKMLVDMVEIPELQKYLSKSEIEQIKGNEKWNLLKN